MSDTTGETAQEQFDDADTERVEPIAHTLADAVKVVGKIEGVRPAANEEVRRSVIIPKVRP